MESICILFIFLIVQFSGCAAPSSSSFLQSNPPPNSYQGTDLTAVLIYNGASSWPAEVDSLASILYNHGIGYRKVTSAELDAMSLEQLMGYGLLVVPGGDAEVITNSLSIATHARLREVVQHRGMNYLGFCAGAWVAVSPAPLKVGEDVLYGIGFVDGPVQQQTSLFRQGLSYALSKASFPDGSRRDLLWYGGPVTPNLPGGVIARYSDGTPAITQIYTGQGFVIISGLHPAATPAIMDSLGLSRGEAIAPDIAWKLLDAGIHKKPLPAF